MIIALLVLASAMIVGGLLSAFFGWDIVLIERGWTMVIAGSFSAGCGAILLGITAAVSKLSRIQSELARLQLGYNEEMREEAPTSSTGVSMAALAGGLLGGHMLGRGEEKGEEKDEKQPDLPLFADEKPESILEDRDDSGEPSLPKVDEPFPVFPPRTTADDVERRDEDEDSEIKVPDFLLGDRARDPYVETRAASVETSYFDEPRVNEREDERRDDFNRDDILAPLSEPVSTREPEPDLEPAREPEPAPVEEEAGVVEEPAGEEGGTDAPRSGATVIGTYNSGDNTYVMFSDGSIEARTPGGIFHFQSLDELKAFIASGGEGGTPAT